MASIFVNELKHQGNKKATKLSIGSLSKGLGSASITGIEMLGQEGQDGPYLFVSQSNSNDLDLFDLRMLGSGSRSN